MTDTNNIAQAITVLRAAFPRQEISSKAFGDMVALWAEILADIPPNVLNMAVMEWIARDTPWFPSVGQIRHIALDLVQCKEGELTPGEGWEEVKRAIRIGRHCFQAGSVKWSSPLVEKAFNALGGWNYFRVALQEDEVADRAHFMRTFEQLQRRKRDLDSMHPAARRLRQEYLDRAARLPPAGEPGPAEYPESTDSDPRALEELHWLADRLSPDRRVPRATEEPDPRHNGRPEPKPDKLPLLVPGVGDLPDPGTGSGGNGREPDPSPVRDPLIVGKPDREGSRDMEPGPEQ
jgi:hypothetical protein